MPQDDLLKIQDLYGTKDMADILRRLEELERRVKELESNKCNDYKVTCDDEPSTI